MDYEDDPDRYDIGPEARALAKDHIIDDDTAERAQELIDDWDLSEDEAIEIAETE